jgi:hypothetical protein
MEMDAFTIITLSALIGGAIAAMLAESWIIAELYGGPSLPAAPMNSPNRQ